MVPEKLPKANYPAQGRAQSNQDVRNDPQFNGVVAHHAPTKQKTSTKTQQYAKQPIDINEVCMEDSRR